ncbi:helix-turn-helix domain-containing protein [Streptomyces cucumeris]|uniref:helix-turn-helix domain-containing protein n=1 Tax=Streptomyces cucumeris TaxID=2962890 RepID=UPI003D718350
MRSLESEVLISDSSLLRYLRGSTVPPWAIVRDLCRALGADPGEYRALWCASSGASGRAVRSGADGACGPDLAGGQRCASARTSRMRIQAGGSGT